MEGAAKVLRLNRPPEEQPQFQRQFTFVDVNDHGPETARIANSHATREWKRAKKWRDRHMPQRREGQRKLRSFEWRKKDAEHDLQSENEAHSERIEEDGFLPINIENDSLSSTRECCLCHSGCEERKCSRASSSPSETFLNADMIDPFNSVFPVRLNSKMRSLVHYCEWFFLS